MHPISADRRRFGLYLLAWGLAGVVLAVLLALSGPISWSEGLALALPLCLVYAFIGLSAFYSCRAAPLRQTGLTRLLATHAMGAAVASALWLLIARGWARALDRGLGFAGAEERFIRVVPLFAAVGALFFLLAVAVHYVIAAAEASRQAETQALELLCCSREAELKALRAQLQPHFLFNSLNSISALTTANPEKARQMCLLLSDLLRRSLSLGSKEMVSLSEEMALVERFLAIEKVRFGARLQTEFRLESGADAWPVPPLLLQPLVENAVTHGIANLVEGGVVAIEARPQGAWLEVAVDNPCDLDRSRRAGAGVGLDNVRRRIETLYGRDARFAVKEADGHFRVELSLPATRPA